MNQWMCELCFPLGKEIGIIAPGGYSLIYNEGKYHILGGQGHQDDEIITFEEMPWPDPDPDCADELPPDQSELAYRWLDEVDRLSNSFKMHPETAFAFLSSCEEAGWKKGGIAFWLFNKAGRLIQGLPDEEKKEEKAEPYWNYRVMIHSHRRRNLIEGVYPASKDVAVHEVHYKDDKDDKPYGWTKNPVSLIADTTEELAAMLDKIKLSLDKPAIPYETLREGDVCIRNK